MKTKTLPPHAYALMSATRHIGYSLEAAIADLIDNSIAAECQNVDVLFDNSIADPYIAILDDGTGMDADGLENAMQYGSADPTKERSETDLGRYGLGLKTASMSQCTLMTVVSKKHGKITSCRWDLNYIKNHKKEIWPLLILDNDEWADLPAVQILQKRMSGTLVIWQNIDLGGVYERATFDDDMFKVSEHLSLVFHRYLYGESGIKKIKIRVNNGELQPKDPFLQYVESGKRGYQSKATQPIGMGKERITLQAYTLPHTKELSDIRYNSLGIMNAGLRRTQGFYIYRNRRLITYGNWFGLKVQGEFFKLSRIKVDIPNSMDLKWSLDVKKSVAMPPKQIIGCLRAYVDSVVKQSLAAIRVQVFGKKVKNINDNIQVWEPTVLDGVITSIGINRKHPVIRSAVESGAITEKFLKLLERTLPVDIIYFSRSSEQKMENETPLLINEMIDMLKDIIKKISSKSDNQEVLFNSILDSDPFALYAKELQKYKKEILDEIK